MKDYFSFFSFQFGICSFRSPTVKEALALAYARASDTLTGERHQMTNEKSQIIPNDKWKMILLEFDG